MDILSQNTATRCTLKGAIQEIKEQTGYLKQHTCQVRANRNMVSSLQEVMKLIQGIVGEEEGEKIFYCDTYFFSDEIL